MPAERLRAEIGKHRKSMGWSELFELKRIFGVSVQALTYRCKDLGIFSDTLFRLLFDEFSRRGWRSPPYREPYARKGEKPRRFERLCFRALVEGAVSDAKAAELLGTSVHELNRRVEEPPAVEAAAALALMTVNVLVSDTSVLIDLERGSLLETTFGLTFQLAVPDLLYHQELAEHGGPALIELGLRVEELDGDGVTLALRYRRGSPTPLSTRLLRPCAGQDQFLEICSPATVISANWRQANTLPVTASFG